MKPPRSIQTTLSWWLAAQTFGCLLLTSVAIYVAADRSFDLTEREDLLRHGQQLRQQFANGKTPRTDAELQLLLREFFQTYQDLGAELRRGGELVFEARPAEAAHPFKWVDLPPDPALPELSLRLGTSIASDRRVLQRLGLALFFVALTASLIVSLTGARLVRRGLRPLATLAREVQAVGPHRAGVRIDASAYGSEIAPFVAQFNAMLDRAERAYLQLEAFNAEVAHELRTPLANLIGQTEVELSKPRTAEALQETLASNLEEVRRLSGLIDDMLFLSRADRGVTARRQPLDTLRSDIEEVVDFHAAEIEDRRLTVRVRGDAGLRVDRALFRRAVSNLVGNAVRYALPASTIEIAVEHRDDAVWLTVANAGTPIPPGAEQDVFKRFYRLDPSRAGDNHGLGLAIVAAIARMHGGSTRASSAAGTTTVGFSIGGAAPQAWTAPQNGADGALRLPER